MRTVQDALSATPIYCYGEESSQGYDTVFILNSDGTSNTFIGGTFATVTDFGVVPAMTLQGAGYSQSAPPAVTISAPPAGGRQATANAIVDAAGQVVTLQMIDPGYYPTGGAPTITIAAPPGTGTTATATATLSNVEGEIETAATACQVGDVAYFNFPDRPPRFYSPNSTAMTPMGSMDSQWTCVSLRTFADRVIALNVTKPASWYDPKTGILQTGGTFDNMFKWSEITLYGATPSSWDPDDVDSTAGENQLEDFTAPILDGLGLRGSFLIYSENEVWAATPVISNDIWTFEPVFTGASGQGIINTNCVVEVDGIHYVMGPKDIYKTDGVTRASIIDKRNRDFIYRNLNKGSQHVCFAAYNPALNTITFGYQTGDTSASFQGAKYCNQGAVYDITDDTWAFIDLPNVTNLTMANVDTIATYATIGSASPERDWNNTGGSYYDQENTFVKYQVGTGVLITGAPAFNIANNRLLAYDYATNGALALPYTADANTLPFIERTGIALDQLGSDLETYKLIRRILPLIVQYDPEVSAQVQVGWSNTPAGNVTWGNPITFNPATQYKVDVMNGGRYLAIRFLIPGVADFDVAGFDLDIVNGGSR